MLFQVKAKTRLRGTERESYLFHGIVSLRDSRVLKVEESNLTEKMRILWRMLQKFLPRMVRGRVTVPKRVKGKGCEV